jgi:hypothetical protein
MRVSIRAYLFVLPDPTALELVSGTQVVSACRNLVTVVASAGSAFMIFMPAPVAG